jgi:hypothetical protein
MAHEYFDNDSLPISVVRWMKRGVTMTLDYGGDDVLIRSLAGDRRRIAVDSSLCAMLNETDAAARIYPRYASSFKSDLWDQRCSDRQSRNDVAAPRHNVQAFVIGAYT